MLVTIIKVIITAITTKIIIKNKCLVLTAYFKFRFLPPTGGIILYGRI
jgi:hypothetical protein